ncbi:unnamed protein product [Linum tenue]|uniref:Uncharacterized protein n=1 Tax=Linum tenue TaxID=586396 RepID=A0AAV0LHP4_9ROSI|nr:unnamed protein product [Linum tenue]
MLCFSFHTVLCYFFFYRFQEWRRSGQIPAFGDWKTANELPITQYFDCARQAGLIRYSNSSGECDRPLAAAADHHRFYAAADYQKPTPAPPCHNHTQRKTRLREKRGAAAPPAAHVKDRKHGRVRDATEPTAAEPPRKPQRQHNHKQKHSSTTSNDAVPQRPRVPVRPPKAVDEDLYKIPPDLLRRSSKRTKVPGFLACFVPSACAS